MFLGVPEIRWHRRFEYTIRVHEAAAATTAGGDNDEQGLQAQLAAIAWLRSDVEAVQADVDTELLRRRALMVEQAAHTVAIQELRV